MNVYLALARQDHGSPTEILAVCATTEVAQKTVHGYYRDLVPVGEDEDFAFLLDIGEGLKPDPPGDDMVIRFESEMDGMGAWVEEHPLRDS